MSKDITFSRRYFMKVSVVASAATLLPCGGHAAPTVSGKGPSRALNVTHEWAPLKETMVGIPHLKIPTSIPRAIRQGAPGHWVSLLEPNPGKTLAEAAPGLHARMTRQMDAAIDILTAHGVTVRRPKKMTESEEGYLGDCFPSCGAQLYPRDPLLVIGPHAIETETAFPFRRRERFGIRRALARRLALADTALLSMPPAAPHGEFGASENDPLLEGGDVLVLGRDILVGNSGNASNTEGIRWLARCLGPGYRVHEVKLSPRFLHLDCCLSTPRPGLAVACREAFPHGLPEFFNTWQVIDVSAHKALTGFACNGLILNEQTILMGTELPELSRQLRAAGQEVIETPFDAVSFFGGSLRCWHQALVREKQR